MYQKTLNFKIVCFFKLSKLIVEGVSTSETSVNYYGTTRRIIPQSCHIVVTEVKTLTLTRNFQI